MVEYRCAREPQKRHSRSFCVWEPQKLSFFVFLRMGCARKPHSYKARWSIAAHGHLKNSTTGVCANGNSGSGIFAVPVRSETPPWLIENKVFWCTSCAEAPKTEFLRFPCAETLVVEFLRFPCAAIRHRKRCISDRAQNFR